MSNPCTPPDGDLTVLGCDSGETFYQAGSEVYRKDGGGYWRWYTSVRA